MRNNHYWDLEDYRQDYERRQFEQLQKEGDPIKFLKYYLGEINFEYFMESVQLVDCFAAGKKDYIHDDYSIRTDKINIYTSGTNVVLHARTDARIVYEAGRLSGYDSDCSAECSYELNSKTIYNKFTKVIETINDLSLHELGKDNYNYEQLSKLDNIITHLHGINSFRACSSDYNTPEVELEYDGSWNISYRIDMNDCFLNGKNQTITGNVYHQNTIFNIKDWMYLQKHPELNGFL